MKNRLLLLPCNLCRLKNNRVGRQFVKWGLVYILIVGISACGNHEKTTSTRKQNPEDIGLKDVAEYHFGAAVKPSSLWNHEAYRNVVLKEMNSLTAENAMKMPYLSEGRGEYHWGEADSLVQFAQENGLRIHGHTLVWHNSVPQWMKNYETDREGWKRIMQEYIQAVVTHWKGKVTSWDVVNEAVGDDGKLKPGFWLDKIGPDFIELAFKYAHEADPDALLFYNDYGHEYSEKRLEGINRLLVELKEKGIPVHGTGLQMHTSINRKPGDLRNAVLKSAQTGLLVHISELDIALNREKNRNMVITDSILQVQCRMYEEVAQAMADIPAAQRYGITLWGVGDNDSFMHSPDYPEQPLPFDSIYCRKLAYQGLLSGCGQK